ncbi:hypothetical protein K7432_012700 [Basidiobolus ranarum]|uniref:Lysozyme-like protein n=1 Tax=Basidiobolus ranarum TaxID=34480 RepID=A0ABR2WKF7_9FUNG
MKFYTSVSHILLLIATVTAASFPYCQDQFSNSPQNCAFFTYRKPIAECVLTPPLPFNGSFTPVPPEVRKNILAITNAFETQDTKLDYSFCKNLKDGKGFTCGFAGFSTATGTALSVITDYKKDHLRSPFGKYFISLLRFSNQTDCNLVKGDPSNFDGFCDVWRRVSCQASFRKSQNRALDIHVFEPAIKLANEVGIQSYLGKAIFFDTVFQHGYQTDDGFSLRSIIRLAGPLIGPEVEYLDRFLRIRRRILCCYPDTVLPGLADRVEDFQSLLRSGNTRLSPPINLPSHQIIITGQEIEDQVCSSANVIGFPISLLFVWLVYFLCI